MLSKAVNDVRMWERCMVCWLKIKSSYSESFGVR